MQYPLISEYVEAIKSTEENLQVLSHLRPVMDDHGEPYRSSGAFAVVFKMADEATGKVYALKCFTEEQVGRAEAYRLIADELDGVESPYLTTMRYYDKELFVDSSICDESDFPVLLMDWIDGETMETYIATHYSDAYDMSWLCYRFCKMAAWLRSQPFAHGDLKPDNIMVRPDGSLTLIDYDGMFVPAMKGWPSPTLGTKDFSLPSRTINDFDETLDDFSLASIALSLKAIALNPTLLDTYGAPDRLLFSAADYRDLSQSEAFTALFALLIHPELETLLSQFLLCHAQRNLASTSFRLFNLPRPTIEKSVIDYAAVSKVTEEELADAWTDEFGAKYSKDRKRLLKGPNIKTYCIKEGTVVICEGSFMFAPLLTSILIPNSVTTIGGNAFEKCI